MSIICMSFQTQNEKKQRKKQRKKEGNSYDLTIKEPRTKKKREINNKTNNKTKKKREINNKRETKEKQKRKTQSHDCVITINKNDY